MSVFGLRISRKVIVLALIAFVLVAMNRRGTRVFPNWTLRQRAEP